MKFSFAIAIVLTVIIEKISENEMEAKGKEQLKQNAYKMTTTTKKGTKNGEFSERKKYDKDEDEDDDEEDEEDAEDEDESDEDEESDESSSLSEEEEWTDGNKKKQSLKKGDNTSPNVWNAKMRKYENEYPTKMKALIDRASGTVGTAQNNTKSAKNISCGKVRVSSMLQLQYSSLVDDTKKQIFRVDKPYKSEKFELAFIGFTGERRGGPLPNGKCVTVKIVEIDDQKDDSEEVQNEEQQMRSRAEKLIETRKLNEFYVIGELQEKIESNLRRHLVEMFDVGELKTPQDNRMRVLSSVTEMSNDGFHEWIYGMNTYFLDDDEFAELIGELAWPIRELHQMAMHLDIKPKSYVYVRVKKGKELLKLTNFGNSEMISEKKSANGRKRANLAKGPKEFHKFTAEYASPELHVMDENTGAIVSPKSDMWSLGFVLFELLILQSPSFYHLREEPEKRDKLETDVRKRLLEIGALYKGFTVDSKKGVIVPIEFEEYQWPYAFWDALYDILRIWRHFPRTALLITNLLDPNFTRRMTAKGLLDFLDEKCYPPEVEEQMNSGEIRLFNRVNATEFMEKIEDRIKVAEKRKDALAEDIRRLLEKGGGDAQRLAEGVKERIEQKHASRVTLKKNIHKWTRLRHWLGDALEKRAQTVDELVGMAPKGGRQKGKSKSITMMKAQCDTETTALDESEVPTNSAEQWEDEQTQRDQPNLKRKLKEEKAEFELPNKKLKGPFGNLANEQKAKAEEQTAEEAEEMNSRRVEEWRRIREEIGQMERLQREGKLAKMPIYEQCVKTVKVDIRELKKLSEKYGAIGKGSAPGENVPNPPTMTKDAVRRKRNRSENVPKGGKAMAKIRAKSVKKMKV